MRSQQGQVAAVIITVLIVMGVALMIGRKYFGAEAGLDQRELTLARMKKVSEALVAFAVLNKRLPCPASGTSSAGTEDAASPFATCNADDGVVPWAALAIKRDDALDGWGRKISYRAYTDAIAPAKSLTREPNLLAIPPFPGGVNMTNCNSSLGAAIDSTLDVNFHCRTGTPPPNMPEQFLAARGNMLVVEDSGTTRNGNAFVLISHGDTGLGAFAAEGATARNTLPDNGGREFTNTGAGGTYWILPRKSLPDTPASDPSHFDDVVTYMSAAELALRAKLAARSWSDYALATPFDAPTVEAAAPGFDHTTSEDTGHTTLAMGGYRITASSQMGAVTIGFREQNLVGGIGVIGATSTSGDLNSYYGERLIFQLGAGSEFHKTSFAFNAFQILHLVHPTFGPVDFQEIAEVSFWRGGDLLQASSVLSWDDQQRPTRCLFELVAGAVFDRIDVRPVTNLVLGWTSRFAVSGIKSCSEAAGSCIVDVPDATANSIPVENCPNRPPGAATAPATAIGTTTATLHGFAQDNGADTNLSFDYGLTCSYPSNVAAAPASISAGAGKTAVSAAIGGLACNSSYYFRTKAESAGGTTTGNDTILKTSACAFPTPVAASAQPTGIGTTAATLNGVANDNGSGDTTVTFEYGPTSCYGSSIAAVPGTIVDGTGAQAVTASLTGLDCGTRYHYRLRAQSAAGTDTGRDIAFTTAACP